MMENPGRRMNAKISDSLHCVRLNHTLQEFNTKEKYTDVYFICKGGIVVKAHKLMICSVSIKLKQIFLELPEIVRIQEIHVSVPDIEAKILRLVFDFLYEGQVKLDHSDSPEFHAVMTELGFPLAQHNTTATASQSQPSSQPSTQLSPQIFYLQGPSSSQGQPQYIMAPAGSLGQAQVQGPLMTPMVQGIAQPSQQPMIMTQPSQQPMIMTQANGQLIQSGGQVLTNQAQQMQVVQQNNSQVMAMNNQMQVVQQNVNPIVSMNNQVVGGNQLVQCSTQAVVQGSQPLILNNNQIQMGLQNQVLSNNYVVNQNPQPVGSQVQRVRSSNVITPVRQLNRTQTAVRTPQVMGRNRPAVQPQVNSRVNNGAASSTGNLSVEVIHSVLQQYEDDLSTLTAKKIRSSLEEKFGMDFSSQEQIIEELLQNVLASQDSVEVRGSDTSGSGVMCGETEQLSQSKSQSKKPKQHRRKQSFLHPQSDDEADEDFDPHQHAKRKSSKNSSKKDDEGPSDDDCPES